MTSSPSRSSAIDASARLATRERRGAADFAVDLDLDIAERPGAAHQRLSLGRIASVSALGWYGPRST